MRANRLVWTAALLEIPLLGGACGVPPGDEGSDWIANVASADGDEASAAIDLESQELYALSAGLWGKRNISVCWKTAGNDAEKSLVKRALRGQRSWSGSADVNFTGWNDCVTSGSANIEITLGDEMVVTGGLGDVNDGKATMELDSRMGVELNYTRCSSNTLTREECISTVALHEFGHALGYAHEHNRLDTNQNTVWDGSETGATDCGSSPQGGYGDAVFGSSWDQQSIMSYCPSPPPTDLSGLDRRGTDRFYGQYNGDSRRLLDFNQDGRADILCHDVVSGQKWLDHADANGQFGGTDDEPHFGWCKGDTQRLYKGDFDGRSGGDLLCHDFVSGRIWVDRRNSSGELNLTNWEGDFNLCIGAKERLFVGDANGDGRDDLICVDSATGRIKVDLAGSNGEFTGANWNSDVNFCNFSTGRIVVGDFNNDNRADVLCHDVATGAKHVRYATAGGQYNGSTWSANPGWCKGDAQEVLVGDFNADGRDDLLCIDTVTAKKWIDFANTSGQFQGTDKTMDNGWCIAASQRVLVGDFNNDSREDLLCHDVRTGKKWIDLADSTGSFNGSSDWHDPGDWCGSDGNELH